MCVLSDINTKVKALAFTCNGQDLILFYEFPSDAILDGDFLSRIVYNNRIAEVTAAYITSLRSWKENVSPPFIPCLDIGLFWYHEKCMCGWIPHFIAHEPHLRTVSFGHLGGEGEGSDVNCRFSEQFQLYSLVYQEGILIELLLSKSGS